MNVEQETKSIFHKCVEDILIYCLTYPINYRYGSNDDTKLQPLSLSSLVDIYTDRFVQTFTQNKKVIFANDEDEMCDIYNDFMVSIGIVSGMHSDDRNYIENILETGFDEIRQLYDKSEMYGGMGVGTCCYCNGDCNPQSQACGPCMRG